MAEQRRGPLTAFGWALIVAAVLVLGGAVALYFSRPEPLPENAPLEFRFATESHTNPEGGYEIRYPPRWTVDDIGGATRVLSPRRDVTVTFGKAPEGSLQDSVAALFERVAAAYRQTRIVAGEVRNVRGSLAALLSGTAVNEAGVDLRFLAIAIATERGNYGITVFTAADSDPQSVVPPVNEIVSSFQLV